MSNQSALQMIRAEYARAIGPMAHVLIDEMLTDFNAADEPIPAEKFPELIEKLSWEIHSEHRRVAFQEETLRQLRSLA